MVCDHVGPEENERSPRVSCAAPQGAVLLGYSSASSFLSALSQGRLPGLAATDALRPGARGGPRRMWKRSTILEELARRTG
jgi:hypothetical protein